MIIFFLLATLLVGLTLLATYLIWTYRKNANLTTNHADWQVMLAKRNEIENDVLLPLDTRTTLRNEWIYIADTLLTRDQKIDNSSHFLVKKYNTYWILGASLLCAGFIYFLIGNWSSDALKLHTSAPLVASNAELPITDNPTHPGSNDSIEKMIAQLEVKLKASPDNLDGWVLLARSLGIKQDFAGASAALENALRLAPGHPDLLADLADALAMTNNKSLAGRPTELIQEALKNAPDHAKALSLAATAAMQNNDMALAANYWKRLRATFPSNAPDVAQIDAIIASLNVPSAATNKAPEKANGFVEGRVVLSSQLRHQLSKTPLPQNAMLYIIAKAPSGPPMPVAVTRIPAEQLLDKEFIPFKLDDSQAMSPELKLSSQPHVNLEARLSMTGTATKQAGDFYGVLPDVRLGTNNVHLEIQSVL